MNLPGFFTMVVLVSASGVLSPGPLFFATVLHGAKTGSRAGLLLSIGHTLVELPLVSLLALGLLGIASHPTAVFWIGIVGGVFMMAFGIVQLRDCLILKRDTPSVWGDTPARGSLVLGVTLTAFNPFFVAWWLTIGSKLIVDALALASAAGVAIMYISHIWMDYVWLMALGYLAKKGTSLVGARAHKAILVVFGIVLIYFGATFIAAAI